MKKKKIIIICTFIVLIICLGLLIKNLQSPKIIGTKSSEKFSQTSSSDEDWKIVDAGNVRLENEAILFEMNSENTHFTVTHKQSGITYHSVSQPKEMFEPSVEQMSEVIITYYDSNSAKANMNSYDHSVQGKSYEVKTDGSAIRVYYSIQKSQKKIFVPEVISQKVFEEEILTKIESGPRRRLKGFYTLYESENSDSDTKEMKQKYSALKDENLYVLNGTAGEHNYSEITGYYNTAGYTQSNYIEEAERLGLGEGIGDNLPAAFVIPVEYTLKEDSFVATVLTDKITSDSENYKLTNVSILPYFSSCGETQSGWFLVPDGSGAIIDLVEKNGNKYSQNIYGNDMAIESSVKPNIMQNAGMPVFGFHNGNNAFFASISGGEAVASVNAEVYGKEFLQNHIYSDFQIRAFDSSSMGELRNQADFNLYSSNYIAEFPQVTYTMFPDADTTYSDMANKYREMLIAEGVLGEKLENSGTIPIYIDFTGYETTEESFLGIATKGKTELSTLEDIQNAVAELKERGVTEVNLRLKAYTNDGIYSKVSNGFTIDKCVGNKKALEQLAKQLVEDNGVLFLENNISTVYNTGNSYKKMTHAVRNLKKTVVYGIDFDLVSRKSVEAVNQYYLTSPAYFKSLTNNFIQTLSKESEDAVVYGYSWSDFGTKLWSDFHAENTYDRTQTLKMAEDTMEIASNVFAKTITDGSNLYALSKVSTVLNIPLQYSALSSESYSIPFYQMVVHGYIDYSGAPINTSADSGKTYLASIESGANLYYSCYTSDEEPLKETAAGTLTYPTLISASYDDIEARYKEFQEIFSKLRCQIITNHERIAEEVFVTTYEDGTKIVVNYSETEIKVNNRSVPANGFDIVEGGGN